MDLTFYDSQRHLYVFKILNSNGELLNRIISNETFVSENFEHYELERSLIDEEMEKQWRNKQLSESDNLMLLSDYPYKAELEQYRQTLRDWPNTEDFPENRPVSFNEFISQE